MTFRRIVSTSLALAVAALMAVAPAFAADAKVPAAKVNLNTATADQLAEVPGLGPKLAARIVEQRQKSGPFKSVEDVMAVKGIGEKSFAKFQSWLTVGESPRPSAGR
jgi:competence protein ComEA